MPNPTHLRRFLSAAAALPLAAAALLPNVGSAQLRDPGFTIEQALSLSTPFGLVGAKNADRIAWIEVERGMRNVFTAAAPDYRPVRLTSNTEDDGVDMTGLAISDDGSVVIYTTGHSANRSGQIGNQGSHADGGQRILWAASTSGNRAPWRVMYLSEPAATPAAPVVAAAPAAAGGRGGGAGAAAAAGRGGGAGGGRGGGGGGGGGGADMQLSPDGRWLLFVRDGQVRRVPVDPGAAGAPVSDAVPPFFVTLGQNSAPVWSPDGKKVAFVSSRTDQRSLFPTQGTQVTHSYITLYDVETHSVSYLTATVDRDTGPVWTADGRSIGFMRRPGLPFGHFATAPLTSITPEQVPAGLVTGHLESGYAMAFMIADVATGEAREVWHSEADNTVPNAYQWVGDHLVFSQNQNTWTRYFSVSLADPDSKPVMITPPGDGQVERVAYSPDGRFMYFTSNLGDQDRRHLWRVPLGGGQPQQLTRGELNEIGIAVHGSGNTLAVLQSGARQGVSVVLMNPMGAQARIIAPRVPEGFPAAKHVVPQAVPVTAADGIVANIILFVPPDIRPGEKRPALVYAHGNGGRLMLGYPDQGSNAYYQLNYAFINYLVNKGYIVAASNYRGDCACYSQAFNEQRNYGANGVSEYGDIIAAGLYLKGRPDVDVERIGIWGLSYGGWLTGEALSRNSDVFKAGAILAGVQMRSQSFDPTNLAFQSSPMFNLEKWTSPTLFIHGDDDRNVEFSQTVGAIQALRARGTPHKVLVLPDETHYFLKFANLVKASHAVDDWFDQMLIRRGAESSGG